MVSSPGRPAVRPASPPSQEQLPDLLTQREHGRVLQHPMPDLLCVAAWPVSGITSKIKAFFITGYLNHVG